MKYRKKKKKNDTQDTQFSSYQIIEKILIKYYIIFMYRHILIR